MNKKNKIIFKGLSALAISLPLATVVACGENTDKTITIGVRAGSIDLMKNIGKQFTKATGYKVKLKIIGQPDMSASYPLWAGSGILPDITLADTNTGNTGIDKEKNNQWFQELDLKDIFTNSKYMISGQDEKYKETSQSVFDDTTFNMQLLNQTLDGETGKYKSFGYTAGPHLLYYWDTNKAGKAIFDGSKQLKWFVPNKDGDGVEEVKSFSTNKTHATSPLVKSDGSHYMNSISDIQEFLNNSALKDQITFNAGQGKDASAFKREFATPSTNPEDRVVSTGTLGFYQRLNSVGLSILDGQPNNNIANAVSIQHEYIVPSGLSQGEAAFSSNGSNNFVEKNAKMDDDEWPNQWTMDDSVTTTNITPLQAAYYNAYFGFFQKTPFKGQSTEYSSTVASMLDAKDLETPFAQHKVLFTEGAMWQSAGIKEVADKTSSGSSEHIKAFSLPFGAPGIDGFAVSSKVSGNKLLIVKKFIRFLMQPQVAVEKAGDATVPILVAGKNRQPLPTDSLKRAITNTGFSKIVGDKVTGITDLYSLSSTKGDYFKYNNTFDTTGWAELTSSSSITRNNYLKRLSAINTKYNNEQKLSS